MHVNILASLNLSKDHTCMHLKDLDLILHYCLFMLESDV